MKKLITNSLLLILVMALAACANLPTDMNIENGVELEKSDEQVDVSGQPVDVLFVKTQTNPYTVKVMIEVENIGFDKEVVLHYTETVSNSGWKDFSAVYTGSLPGNKEAWVAELNFPSPGHSFFDLSVIFAVKYTVNGVTYWDSNDGQNYKVAIAGRWNHSQPHYLLDTAYVAMNSASIYTGTFSGSVLVKNVSYQKAVTILYTTDNWATSDKISATYSSNNGIGAEMWKFNTTVDVDTVEFVISLEAIGNTWWDNNFSNNWLVETSGSIF